MTAAPTRPKRRRTWPQRFLLIVGVVVAITCVVTVAALAALLAYLYSEKKGYPS